MNMGPAKTQVGGFKGFGFGSGAAKKNQNSGGVGGPSGGSKPMVGGLNARKAPPKATGVSNLFAESLEEENSTSSSSRPSWAKLTPEAAAAQRQAAELMSQDPTVFQYDEVLDDIQEERTSGLPAQMVRADVNTQKKRVGLTVLREDTEVKTGTKRSAKYIEKVMIATDRRKVEAQVIEDRLLKKEKDARKDCEVFVTEAFKEELKKRQKFVDELEAQEKRDELKAAEKQEHGRGFADMYRNLLNGGLASSRGQEKVKDVAPAREDLPSEGRRGADRVTKLEEVKEEIKEELEEEEAKIAVKEEAAEEAAPIVAPAPVPEATAAEKAAMKAKEAEERAGKTMSAKERYLARKKAEAEAAAAAGSS